MSSYVDCRMSSYPHLKGSFANVNDENLSLVSSQICNRFFQCIQQQTFATVENKAAEFPPPFDVSTKKSNDIKMDADWTLSTKDF